MLTCIRKAFELVEKHYGARSFAAEKLDAGIASPIPKDEDAVYGMLLPRRLDRRVPGREPRADAMLPRLKPKKFYDLVIEVAIVRPGPIQGDMVHPYLRRRQGHGDGQLSLEGARSGAAQDARRAAVPGAGDEDRHRRRRLHAGRGRQAAPRHGDLPAHRHHRQVPATRSSRAWWRTATRAISPSAASSQIEGFGEYGFPESHAASFALLVYASAWLKCHYPDVFSAALLNAQPMGFYAPAQIVRDAREHGVEVRAADVNHSRLGCTLEPGAARRRTHCTPLHRDMARRHPHDPCRPPRLPPDQGLREDDAKLIVARRGAGLQLRPRPLAAHRASPRVLERLADADAFGSLGLTGARRCGRPRRSAASATSDDDLPLFRSMRYRHPQPRRAAPAFVVARARRRPAADAARRGGGQRLPLPRLSLRAHPASFLRADSPARGIVRNEALRDIAIGTRVTVSGLVIIRQRPGTANGVIFMTIEDETAIANVIVWPKMFERFRPIVLGAR